MTSSWSASSACSTLSIAVVGGRAIRCPFRSTPKSDIHVAVYGLNPRWFKPAVWITFLAVMALIAVILHWGLYAYGVWVGIALVLVSLFIGGIDRRDQRRSGEPHKLLEPTVWMGLLGLTLIVAFVAFTEMGGISSGRIFFSGIAAVWILFVLLPVLRERGHRSDNVTDRSL